MSTQRSFPPHVGTIIHAALSAVEPAAAVRRYLCRRNNSLELIDAAGISHSYDLDAYQNIYLIGAGKASGPMAEAVFEIIPEQITASAVIVPADTIPAASPIRTAPNLLPAEHPVPSRVNLDSARQLVELADQAGADDLVIALISGGASALLSYPVESISLADLQLTTETLLRSGATINEFNTIRKHLSQVKGGRLAARVAPATLLALAVSDVVGNPIDIIGSGPTVPDPSTFADAWAIVNRYNLEDQLPSTVICYLRDNQDNPSAETPKPKAPLFQQTRTQIIASNQQAVAAAVACAQDLGYNTLRLSTFIQGEASQVARVAAGIAQEIHQYGFPVHPPACIVAGGETTVTVSGTGRGGRNQELALAAAIALDGLDEATIICLATDGRDGPTDAAGAWIDGTTVRRGFEHNMNAAQFLANNDAYTFFGQLGDLIITGPTKTNVNDLLVILVCPRQTDECVKGQW